MISSSRDIDQNGFITIDRNPISREGVFKYSSNAIPGSEPGHIYNVYRSAEELTHPDAMKSFNLMPLTDDHPPGVLVGQEQFHDIPPTASHGTTGENSLFENGVLYNKLRIFSNAVKDLIAIGKKQLSMGYRCRFEKMSGVFNGQPYDYIQRNIRGNHIALVDTGRSGPDIAVLDHQHFAFDHFDLALDTQEQDMADEDKKDENAGDETKKEMSMTEVCAMLETIMPQIKAIQDSIAGLTKTDDVEAEAVDGDDAEKDEKKDDKKDDKAMDAAELNSVKSRLDAVEKRDTKAILADIAGRDALAKDVGSVVGTFDHAEMTSDEVVAYALDKLEIKAPKGQERATLLGFMAGRKAAGADVGFAMDTAAIKSDGLLAKRNNKNA